MNPVVRWKIMARALVGVLLALSLFSAACRKKAPKPAPVPATVPAPVPNPTPPPPAPDYLKQGESYFDSGDYPAALNAYGAYLHDHPGGPQEDRVLLRMALSYASREGATADLPRAMQLLQQLVSQHPQSPYRAEAQMLLHLNDEVNRLTDEAAKAKEESGKLRDDSTKLKADMAKRDERIKELTKELEKLKQIDMERRPSRVPR